MGTGGKVAVAVLAVVAAGVLFFVLREGDESTEATKAQTTTSTAAEVAIDAANAAEKADKPKPDKPKPPEIETIVIKGGQPVGGVQELTFTRGEAIQFRVRSDVADHVHLHGYDVMKDVAAGGEVEFDVPATIEGVFEAELEDTLVPIAEITVEPS